MIIAVAYSNGNVYQHFGHTAQFQIYRAENGRLVESSCVDTAGTGHGALAQWLQEMGVDILICGGIGSAAREALDAAGIRVFGGVKGDADEAVELFLAGVLPYDPCACCTAHEGGHGCGHCKH